MKVELNISPEIKEPYIVINAPQITKEVKKVIEACETRNGIIAYDSMERIIVIDPPEIFMVKVEDGKSMVYCDGNKYYSKKRLYEFKEMLGDGFMQISKSAVINLKKVDYLEPYFNGLMNLVLKNGSSEFISRKYLPEFKKHFGI